MQTNNKRRAREDQIRRRRLSSARIYIDTASYTAREAGGGGGVSKNIKRKEKKSPEKIALVNVTMHDDALEVVLLLLGSSPRRRAHLPSDALSEITFVLGAPRNKALHVCVSVCNLYTQ